MNNTIFSDIVKSWSVTDHTLNSLEDIRQWVDQKNKHVYVKIEKCRLEDDNNWFYDPQAGSIHNQKNTFFSIMGIEETATDGTVTTQPIILQQEIGYLGIICKKIDGILYFLMQAKIEPGNINKIQLSPTIQATKSNFTQQHGGKKPPYVDYFINSDKYTIIVDQIQSEQSSRFLKKRNRNLIIMVDDEVPVLDSHCWMTLGQIKSLMRIDNLVNMDTRTVLSCIPFCKAEFDAGERENASTFFEDDAFFRSVFEGDGINHLPEVFHYINDYKMFSDPDRKLVPLHTLSDWEWHNGALENRKPYPFRVVVCDIEIQGREVTHWKQPLFEAMGIAVFGLILCVEQGVLKFLVKATPEIGCFDGIELGPTIQREAIERVHVSDAITELFQRKLESGEGILFDHLLSEEGGRFYHEQNRNILVKTNREELPKELPAGYFLLDFKTLNELIQVNNVLNIQLRNLLSLLNIQENYETNN